MLFRSNINAPMLLRTVASARHIPVSVEWSAPYGGDQAFHLGIHNLPSESGAVWMKIFEEYTANPDESRLTEILATLHELPNVLIVFNHPMWDLYLIGDARHQLQLATDGIHIASKFGLREAFAGDRHEDAVDVTEIIDNHRCAAH